VLRALGVSSRTQAVLAVSQMTQGRAGTRGVRRSAAARHGKAKRRRPPARACARASAAPPSAAHRCAAASTTCVAVCADAGHADRQPVRHAADRGIFWPWQNLTGALLGWLGVVGACGWCAWRTTCASGASATPTTPRCALAPQLAVLVLCQGAMWGAGGVAVLGPGHAVPPLGLI
jgi:hypothetical protein